MPAKSRKRPDKFELYQESVQNPEFEVKFLRRTFERIRQREALRLREDFCGSAILSCQWARDVPGGTAVGIDLHAPTLDYARRKNVTELGDRASRVKLLRRNVLDPGNHSPDVVAAYNFSYFVFKERAQLRDYFESVRNTLVDDGVFFLDILGGPEAQTIQEDRTEYEDFTYVWDQAEYNPITGEYRCHIHFELPDGRRLRRAFTYDWRLWTLPEVRDLLEEVGFGTIDVYWEGTDNKTGSGNGVFRKSLRGDNSLAWVCYIVAAR